MTGGTRERTNAKQKETRTPVAKKSKTSGGSNESITLYLKLFGTVLLLSGTVVIWRQFSSGNIVTFARSDVILEQQSQAVPCSDDYNKDPFPECKPKYCGRVVMDNLVTAEEARHLLGVAKRGLAYGGSGGGASILDLHSGALSKGDKFINIYSIISPEESFTESDFTVYRLVKDKIHDAIAGFFNINPAKLYLTKPTFFSRMNTSEAKTIHDEYWHPHIDKVTYGSFHYTSLLYLTTYSEDFTGGRFIFVDQHANSTVEPRLGRVSFFTSGSENLHFVEKLESGTRYAITISFTCDPKMQIADPVVR